MTVAVASCNLPTELVDEERGVAVLGDALPGTDQLGLPDGFFHLLPGPYSTDLN